MKKWTMLLVLSLALLMLVGCGKNAAPAPDATQTPVRLEGYFCSNFIDKAKYKFEITDIASGDYGGEMTNMENTSAICAYYVVGNEVYIDGTLTYYFVDGYLACIEDATSLIIDENNCITGYYKRVYFPDYYSGSRSREYKFSSDGALLEINNYNSLPTDRWKSTYTIENNIITISSENATDKLFIYYNGVIYPILERV